MIFKILLHSLAIIVLAIIQSAGVSAFTGWLNDLQVFILAALLFLAVDKANLAFIYALGGGVALGFFSGLPFGLHLLALAGAVWTVYLVFENVITNRSLYSFALLALMANAVYKAFLYGFWYSLSWLNVDTALPLVDSRFWTLELKSLLLNLLITALAYQVLSFIGKKYQPAFLASLNRYG